MNLLANDLPSESIVNLLDSKSDKIALVIVCVVVPIITVFAIIKISKIINKQKKEER